ncbi:MAG: NAD(P)H-dependent oxidoreductase [Planctomycetota bacterium]
MSDVKLVAFAGSLRAGSYNHALLAYAVEEARAAGAEVELVRLADLDLPHMDEDLERASGLPAGAKRLKTVLAESHGMLIASPEYNGAPPGILKDAIDWCTRAESKDEQPLAAFKGKVAGIMATSPGRLGGLRGLVHLRAILSGIGVHVIPDQHAVAAAHEVLGEGGKPQDDFNANAIANVARRTVEVARALAAH